MKARGLIPCVILMVAHVGTLQLLAIYLLPNDNPLLSAFMFSLVALLLIYKSWSYVEMLALLKLPGPIPLPIFGNLISVLAIGGSGQNILKILHQRYGPVFELVGMDNDAMVVSTDVSVNRVVLKSTDRGDLEDGWEKKNFRVKFAWLGLAQKSNLDLFARRGHDWKVRRQLLQPAFDQKHVRAMLTGLSDTIQEFLDDRLDELEGTRKSFDALLELQHFGLEVLCKTSLGLSLNSFKDPSTVRWMCDAMGSSSKTFVKVQRDAFAYLRFAVLPALGMYPSELKRRSQITRLRAFILDLVVKAKEKEQRYDPQSSGQTSQSTGGHDNLIGVIIKASIENPDFGNDAVVDELLSFMFAGYDTTSVTIANILHHMAIHPQLQSNLQDSIDRAVMGADAKYDDGKRVDYAKVLRNEPLLYLSACIRESQRIQPAGLLLKRRLQEDALLPKSTYRDASGKGLLLRKGRIVFVPLYLMHHDPTEYPNPDEFQPERWLVRNTHTGKVQLKAPTPGYYYPFGGGPKMCVGFQLAEKQVKMATLAIFDRYKVELTGKVVIRDEFVTGPETMPIRLRKRVQAVSPPPSTQVG